MMPLSEREFEALMALALAWFNQGQNQKALAMASGLKILCTQCKNQKMQKLIQSVIKKINRNT